jgi:uncharacterized coiled-coil protein SlyX
MLPEQRIESLERQVALQRTALHTLLRLMLVIQRHRVRSMSDPEGHLRGAAAERELEVLIDRL